VHTYTGLKIVDYTWHAAAKASEGRRRQAAREA
jgi:hypothetical protein